MNSINSSGVVCAYGQSLGCTESRSLLVKLSKDADYPLLMQNQRLKSNRKKDILKRSNMMDKFAIQS